MVSFFSDRTVLIVSDEALYIYACSSQGPRLADVVLWDNENFEEDVVNILTKNCKSRPVFILNDMVEQHYRKERVLRSGVSLLERSNLIKRKLNIAFPNYPVRAAYALKERADRGKNKPASDIYIFAALPESEQMSKTLGAVSASLVSVSGLGLLPVEASHMIKALSDKVLRKNQSRAQWIIFIGQHRNGGLRQVVVKNGDLALTRMTPVIGNEENPETWADEVHQEFNATMSYLSRFGFQPEDGNHIIAVANKLEGEAFQALLDSSLGFTSLTAHEAASLLKLRFNPLQDERYADPLHAAWVAHKNQLLLPMKSERLERVLKPRSAAMAASMLLFSVLIVLGYWLVSEMGALRSTNEKLESQRQVLTQTEMLYQAEIQRKQALGFDVLLVQSSVTVYDQLEKNNIRPLELYKNVGLALGQELRLDQISVKRPSEIFPDIELNPAEAAASVSVYEAVLNLTYPSAVDIDKANKEIADLQLRLQNLFPDSRVRITKALKDYGYNKGLIIEAGDLEKQGVDQDFLAAIEIKGPPSQ